MGNEKVTIRDLLEPILPPIVFRNNPNFKPWTGFSSRTVANEDSRGTGPDQRIVVGKVTGYPKESLLAWLESKVKLNIEPKGGEREETEKRGNEPEDKANESRKEKTKNGKCTGNNGRTDGEHPHRSRHRGFRHLDFR